MESMYQRGKIQEESLHYESLKHSGEKPIIGVNTFKSETDTEVDEREIELIRSTKEEKHQQIDNLRAFQERNRDSSQQAIEKLKDVAREDGNIFEELMETVKVASLGQITHALYQVGGQYRRNM